MLTDIKSLFDIYENVVANIIISGILLEFNDDGTIRVNNVSLTERTAEIERINKILNNSICELSSNTKILPPISYNISDSDIKSFCITDDMKDIVDATSDYSYTHIYKNTDYDSITLSSYGEKLRNLHLANEELSNKNSELLKEIAKERKQKKQLSAVVWLSAIIVIGVIAFVGAIKNKNYNINNANRKIITLESICKSKTDSILLLTERNNYHFNQYLAYKNLYTNKIKHIDSLYRIVSSFDILRKKFPICISSIAMGIVNKNGDLVVNYGTAIYSSNTYYLSPKITYFGFDIGSTIELKVKLIKPNGEISSGEKSHTLFSYSYLLYVSSGEVEKVISGWGGENKGHWSSGNYKLEIWYEDICLKDISFSIY